MLRVTPFVLIITLILPPAIIAGIPGGSLSTGLLAVSVLWALVSLTSGAPPYSFKKSAGGALTLAMGVITALVIHAVISSTLVAGVDFVRLALSCFILLIEFVCAVLAADKLLRVPQSELVRAADRAVVFLILCGIAGAAGAPSVGGFAYGKGVVFFSEPSHYALAYLPVLMVSVSVAERRRQLLLIIISLAIAGTLENLTMVAGTVVIAALQLRGTASFVITLLGTAAVSMLDFTYYLARLDFSANSTNLSALVYMQGWENALLNFQETNGFGLGFQQLGIAGSTGDFTERIALLLGGDYINLLDGGSTATKLVGEFGALGCVILIGYLALAGRAMLYIRRQQRLPAADRDVRRLFFCSLLFTYMFEILIRGMGYFSAGGFLTLTAMVALRSLPLGAVRRRATHSAETAPASTETGLLPGPPA